MDNIYENADATIVAVHGDDSNLGLPGVSLVPREQQPTWSSLRYDFMSTSPSIRSLVKVSIWNTRGWTYQEARLSRCVLFFMKYQVYFVCR